VTINPSETSSSPSAAVAAVAAAALLSPLNTSIMPVALPVLQHELGVGASESTWLLSGFAIVSAIGYPLAGHLADRYGPRRVLAFGLVLVTVSAVGVVGVASFPSVMALRALQALGTSATFPAGLALLQSISSGDGARQTLPTAWLGAIAVSCNAAAASGPVVGGLLTAASGWRTVFLVNLPIALLCLVALFRIFPRDQRRHETTRRSRRPGSGAPRTLARLLSVYTRFGASCAVFFAAFFALPLWLQDSRGISASLTGVLMLPLIGASLIATPLAVRSVSRCGIHQTLTLGAIGLGAGSALLTTIETDVGVIVCVTAMLALGAAHGLNNLGMQAEVTMLAPAQRLGMASGLLQTARFTGAAVAAALVGLVTSTDRDASDFNLLWMAIGLISLVALLWSARLSATRSNA